MRSLAPAAQRRLENCKAEHGLSYAEYVLRGRDVKDKNPKAGKILCEFEEHDLCKTGRIDKCSFQTRKRILGVCLCSLQAPQELHAIRFVTR